MTNQAIYAAGNTSACRYAASYLRELGLNVTDDTQLHIRYLLLDIPSFGPSGQLRGGGFVENLLAQLPKDILICGGNLNHTALEEYETVDFLKDDGYLCENAYITAECALDVAFPYLSRTLRHCPVLIIGWGRIGKCLARILKNLDADVTVAARKTTDRAMIQALGFTALEIEAIPSRLSHYRLLYNTVPQSVLNGNLCREDCVKIELASKDGLSGEDIIIARGLPGLHMPESSGKLIADTFIRLCYGR